MEKAEFQRILIPTDMSDFANLALRYGALFRERAAAKLTLMYADELYLPVDLLEAPLGYYLENAPESREKFQSKLNEYGRNIIGGPFETVLVQDTPTRAILNTAADIDADLIIMGTHGRRGVRRAILGSVTENVLHETEIPVLTVTPALMRDRENISISRIVCPVNFTHVARAGLAQACRIAQLFSAELTVMYVVEGIEAERAAEVETAFKQWVDPQVREHTNFSRLLVRDGDPAERVLNTATETNADLIVIGAQHKFFSDATIIGTTTQRITRFARCPVMTVVRQARTEVYEMKEEEELSGVTN